TVRSVLLSQSGPTVLVGHCYGGAVITNLSVDAPNVIALIYIAAFAPDKSEIISTFVDADHIIEVLNIMRRDIIGFLWLAPINFLEYLASDLDPTLVRVLAASQTPIATNCFLGDQLFGTPAW